MASHLVILSAVLSGRRRTLPDPVDSHRDIWFDTKIGVQNTGRSPLHVVDELRGLSYDQNTHTLTLRLHEPAPGPLEKNPPAFHLPAPHTVTVGPGETATIAVSIPAELKTLRPGPDRALTMERTDLFEMQTIRCEIASSEQPIESRGAETAHALRTRLAKWGKIATLDAAVKPIATTLA